MYSSLKKEYFVPNSESTFSAYFNEYLPKMKEVGLKLFTMEQMNTYFSNFNSQTTYPHVVANIKADQVIFDDSILNREGVHCKCNVDDDWCNSGECFRWVCGEGDIKDIGCGWWLQEDCNGFCATTDDEDPFISD